MKNKFIHRLPESVFSKILINIIISSVLAVPLISVAASGCNPGELCNPIQAQSFTDLINKVLEVILLLGTPIVVFFFIYAGFTFVTSRGDPKRLDAAKSMFMWTVVGAFLVLGARVILSLVSGTVNSVIN